MINNSNLDNVDEVYPIDWNVFNGKVFGFGTWKNSKT